MLAVCPQPQLYARMAPGLVLGSAPSVTPSIAVCLYPRLEAGPLKGFTSYAHCEVQPRCFDRTPDRQRLSALGCLQLLVVLLFVLSKPVSGLAQRIASITAGLCSLVWNVSVL